MSAMADAPTRVAANEGKHKKTMNDQPVSRFIIHRLSFLGYFLYFRQSWQVWRKSRATPVFLDIHSSWYSGANRLPQTRQA